MPVATFQGTVENGQVQLAGDIRLPEKARVYIIVPDFEPDATASGTNAAKFDLAEMASRMPSDYRTREKDFGGPVGRENW